MLIPSGDLLNDRFFKFIVGPDRKEFVVHADVFASLSTPLDVLINGGFSEAAEKCAVWDDVNEKSFDRLRQFAYCGDYSCVEPKYTTNEEKQQGASIPQDIRPSEDKRLQWNLPYCIRDMYQDMKRQSTTTTVRAGPGLREITNHDGRVEIINALKRWYAEIGFDSVWNQRLNTDDLGTEPCENLEEILFYHANLHILAETYCIDELSRVTTVKIAKLLYGHVWTRESVRAVSELISYVFENAEPQDPIRETLIHYMTIIIELVHEEESFAKVLIDVPEFSRGILQKIIKYRILTG